MFELISGVALENSISNMAIKRATASVMAVTGFERCQYLADL